MADVEIEQLGLTDIPEIASFLNDTWGAAYGNQSFPRFTEAYLHWLYAERPGATQLVGCRVNGKLAAFRSLLPRDLSVGGITKPGYLSTHLGIDRALPSALRRDLFVAVHLEPWIRMHPRFDLTYAAIDAAKPHIARVSALYAEHGLRIASASFAHAIVARQHNGTNSSSSVRRGTLADVPEILQQHREAAKSCLLSWDPTPDDLAHRWFSAPESEVYVADDANQIRAAACFYRLETVTAGRPAIVAICEGVLGADAASIRPLLDRGIEYQQRIKAKGLVCENVTHIPADVQDACGLRPSFRAMRLHVITRERLEIGDRWLLDIK
jgi:hypothetical protein